MDDVRRGLRSNPDLPSEEWDLAGWSRKVGRNSLSAGAIFTPEKLVAGPVDVEELKAFLREQRLRNAYDLKCKAGGFNPVQLDGAKEAERFYFYRSSRSTALWPRAIFQAMDALR